LAAAKGKKKGWKIATLSIGRQQVTTNLATAGRMGGDILN
jgi:hypothetical protein